jgi:CheY-like chemotaxis protein
MKSVVVIDDDDDVRDVIVFALENEGFHVSSFANGKLGLDALRRMSLSDLPGLIIVDYLMPEMDGITFMKIIKEKYSDTLGTIPLAMSSAMGSFDSMLPHDPNLILLHKPMDLEDLLQVARSHCLESQKYL